jgi:hypothetical protein
MKPLKWRQVLSWRLAQHCLSPRLGRRGLVRAAERIGGVQAQVLSAAELALWARADGLSREDVRRALWQERTLVKTWGMRGTLHLISAAELPLYVAARGVHHNRNWDGYFAWFGLTPSQHEAFLAAVPEVLGARPMTREELAAAVADRTRIRDVRRLIVSANWGTPLKQSASLGHLCFGPSRGQSVTFVNPRKWLRRWRAVDPDDALREVARRYLAAYGPATRDDFARWWGLKRTDARRLFESLRDELEEVEVEGWRAVALRATVATMREAGPATAVSLVPLFDAYTFGFGRHLEPILAGEREDEVFRPQGWISAAVVVDGRIRGTWNQKAAGGVTSIRVRLFSAPAARVRKGIAAEADRMGAFLGSRVLLEIEQAPAG